ncbi:hypothetical protein GCM10009127_20880 [Alteraurantiacibacter aestuarii]|uniref:sensor histidine kinase n=1 Tax=Alteraurantiacibacter aestuarii TaxID=650004 RepID=UPI0031E1137B
MSGTGPFTARARTDARDWLVEADEPLAGMQLRGGGELPGALIAPAILELVRKAREYRLKLARAITARDGDERVTAWVEVQPDSDGAGCRLAISNWQSEPATEPAPDADRARQIALVRQLSELSARLDPQQQILTVDSQCDELSDLYRKMHEGIGRPWTDFVELEGFSHRQPMHWRLLDGASVAIEGSARSWRAHLVPLGQPQAGRNGFELHLCAAEPLPETHHQPSSRAQKPVERGMGIGLEIAPVLRQPVTRIIANAETIRTQLAGPLADEYSNYAADIASAGEHLLALIEDLTTLELVEEEDFNPAPDQIDLADIARRAAGILGVRAQEREITIDTPKTGETALAIGEFRRVLQILLNLLGNAIRYSPKGSEIWLRVEEDEGRARIIVADQGEGLSEEEQRRVFSKFERLGRSGDGGSGLGLYISRRLATAMHGSLSVESARGQGARFILELPADDQSPAG